VPDIGPTLPQIGGPAIRRTPASGRNGRRRRAGAPARRTAVAGLGDDRAQAESEPHRALEDLEALLLLGMHVRSGHVAVGRELELELEQRAPVSAAVRRNWMRSPLTGLWMICPARVMVAPS
jgi:hypothetical protein